MNVKVTTEQEARAKVLENGVTVESVLVKALKVGLHQLEYRKGHAKVQAERNKMMRQVMKEIQKNPELAEKYGLGERIVVGS